MFSEMKMNYRGMNRGPDKNNDLNLNCKMSWKKIISTNSVFCLILPKMVRIQGGKLFHFGPVFTDGVHGNRPSQSVLF